MDVNNLLLRYWLHDENKTYDTFIVTPFAKINTPKICFKLMLCKTISKTQKNKIFDLFALRLVIHYRDFIFFNLLRNENS